MICTVPAYPEPRFMPTSLMAYTGLLRHLVDVGLVWAIPSMYARAAAACCHGVVFSHSYLPGSPYTF